MRLGCSRSQSQRGRDHSLTISRRFSVLFDTLKINSLIVIVLDGLVSALEVVVLLLYNVYGYGVMMDYPLVYRVHLRMILRSVRFFYSNGSFREFKMF